MQAAAWVFWAVAGLLLAFLLNTWRTRRQAAARARARRPFPQRPRPRLGTGDVPAEGGPPPVFRGVRVVELATHIAAPLVGRVLGDLGAEVVKVEGPEGDIFRKTFVQFERPRTHGTAFELMNLSKSGVQLDLKTGEGRAQMLALLEGADVFVTNVRTPSLEQLGLGWGALSQRFPWLVYARCTAWGVTGPDSARPGYDIGAFWTATGASATVNDPPNFSRYPPGYGDITTSQSLVAGVGFALAERASTGMGRLVDTALLRVGAWTVADAIARVPDQTVNREGKVPDYGLCDTVAALRESYLLRDGQSVVLAVEEGVAEAPVYRQLAVALGLPSAHRAGPAGAQDQQGSGPAAEDLPSAHPAGSAGAHAAQRAWVGRLQRAFSAMDSDQAGQLLRAHGIPHVVTVSARAAILDRDDSPLHVRGAVWDDPRRVGVADLCRSPRVPYELGVGRQSRHGPQCRAPDKGEHTEDYLAHGWSPRQPQLEMPRVSAAPPVASERPPLDGLQVVELRWALSVAVASTTVLLADLGASVSTLWRPEVAEHVAGLSAANAGFQAHLRRGKRDGGAASARGVAAALRTADLLVTDYPREALQALGVRLEDGAAAAAGFPGLSVVVVTPWGLRDSADNRGTLGSGYASTCSAAMFSGVDPRDPQRVKLPAFHTLDMAVSMYALAACGIVRFHAARNPPHAGSGALADVNVHRIGAWVNMIGTGWGTKDPGKILGFSLPQREAHLSIPLPSYNAHGLRCGMWVQLLGLDVPRHLPRLLGALGIKASVAVMVAYTLLRHVLPNRAEPSLMVRVMPVIRQVNRQIAAAMGALSYAEFVALAAKHDIWWCPVRVPAQLLHYPQAQAAGTWCEDAATGRRQVACPLQMAPVPAAARAAPATRRA